MEQPPVAEEKPAVDEPEPGVHRGMEQPPVTEERLAVVTEERLAVHEFEPGVHLSVADGFRFGCGFVLAGIGFYFAVIVIGALALAAAGILGSPISLNSLLGGP